MGFMGGLDLQGVVDVPGVSEEALRSEVRRCIDEYGSKMGSYAVYGCSVSMYDPAAYAPGGKMNVIIDEAVRYAQKL